MSNENKTGETVRMETVRMGYMDLLRICHRKAEMEYAYFHLLDKLDNSTKQVTYYYHKIQKLAYSESKDIDDYKPALVDIELEFEEVVRHLRLLQPEMRCLEEASKSPTLRVSHVVTSFEDLLGRDIAAEKDKLRQG